MKKILLLTDFSDYAQNAIQYAVQLFQDSYGRQLELILLHAYHFPHMASGYGQTSPTSVPEPFHETEEMLDDQLKTLNRLFPDLEIIARLEAGTLGDALNVTIREEMPDFIAMGTRGASEMNGLVIGSNAAKVAKKADCPVLIIPDEAVYRVPQKVVFATDFQRLDDLNLLNPLLEMVRSFNPHFLTLHVLPEGETPDSEVNRMNKILYAYFDLLKYSHHFLEEENIFQGIEAFIQKHQADLLVVIDRERGFFENLFHKSVIKQLAFYSSVPLLVLKE